MKEYVDKFESIAKPYIRGIYKTQYDWYNFLGFGINIKNIHIEHYKRDNIEVLHIVVTPTFIVDMPIFGFDMVAINDKITFICGDLSPTTNTNYKLDIPYENSRDVPEWGDFFSDKVLLYEPKVNEVEHIVYLFLNVFENYLIQLENATFNTTPSLVQEKVNYYNTKQRLNSKTTKILEKKEGKDVAKEFVENILFPHFELDHREKSCDDILKTGKIIYKETKEAHSNAERTLLSKELIKGNISKEHYFLYLKAYEQIFKALKKNIKRESNLFRKLFTNDLLELDSNYEYKELESLKEYVAYLNNLSYLEAQSHLYVCGLGHAYGGKWIAKELDNSYPKSHLTDLPDTIVYDIRYATRFVNSKEANKAYEFITKIYEEIWQN